VELKLPNLGDFADVPIIEVHVAVGDRIAVDDPVLTLESDKATMDIPSSVTGVVTEIRVNVGDRVSEGTVILTLDSEGAGGVQLGPRVTEEAEAAADGPPAYGSQSGVYDTMQIDVPDIGDFTKIPVIEIHVAVGDEVAVDDPLVTLESDKATMDLPVPDAGVVEAVFVSVGDLVSRGDRLIELRVAGAQPAPSASAPAAAQSVAGGSTPTPVAASVQRGDVHAQLVVLGSGPGGYTAAFRAADLGLEVVLIERYPTLGGVCLNVGCIPSKALLHAAKVITEAKETAHFGVTFAPPELDIDKLRGWKESVVGRLTGGLSGLAKQRKVRVVTGTGRFTASNLIEVTAADGGTSTVSFEQAIIACGSRVVKLPFVPHDDPRVIDSTGALALSDVPQRLLVLGGGIIGLEMATVYEALGSKITVVELMDQLIPGADRDIVAPLLKVVKKRYENIYLKTKVTAVEAGSDGLTVRFEGKDAPESERFDAILVAVGRAPNGAAISAEKAGVAVDERGFIKVDNQMRTNAANIFAIGDVVGQPMLAHKAVHEAKVAAEVAAGQKSFFDARVIPGVAYTDPEVAWVGLTETEAKAKGVKYGKGAFPWAASGRSLSLGRDEGITKLLFDEDTERVIGGGIVGPNAGELIAEVAHAIEMGSDATDLGLTIHAHPTLSETVGLAAEAFEGTITDLYLPKKKKK